MSEELSVEQKPCRYRPGDKVNHLEIKGLVLSIHRREHGQPYYLVATEYGATWCLESELTPLQEKV